MPRSTQNIKILSPLKLKTKLRPIRHFALYKDQRLALIVQDRPGYLISSASPNPKTSKTHSFIDAQAMEARYENDLAILLSKSCSFDDFLSRAIAAGFNLFSVEKDTLPATLKGYRITKNQKVIGMLWRTRGQIATIKEQPETGLVSYCNSFFVYDDRYQDLLYTIANTSNNQAEVLSKFKSKGLSLIRLE